jgi:nucleotide-binding universal stress UspA family protein
LAVLDYVIRHAELFGARPHVSLLHVAPDLSSWRIDEFGSAQTPRQIQVHIGVVQERDFEQAFAPARARLVRSGLEFREVRLVGNPGDQLAAYAKRGRLSVLALGSHGYGAFRRAVLGSVAARVAHRCERPLLLVRG